MSPLGILRRLGPPLAGPDDPERSRSVWARTVWVRMGYGLLVLALVPALVSGGVVPGSALTAGPDRPTAPSTAGGVLAVFFRGPHGVGATPWRGAVGGPSLSASGLFGVAPLGVAGPSPLGSFGEAPLGRARLGPLGAPWAFGGAGLPAAPAVLPLLPLLPGGPGGVFMPPAVELGGLPPVLAGVDYRDPTGANLPLVRVAGYEDHALSPSFRVRDFATRDGAPFARIDPALVQGLERLQALVGPVSVISGYRHPAYNAAPRVGGAMRSRHQAGQAADVWSSTRTSVEVARAAVAAMGCGVGLGLGRNTVHIDVRATLSTWTYPGAPLSRAAFDLWVHSMCQGRPGAPTDARRRAEVRWLASQAEDREEWLGSASVEELQMAELAEVIVADSVTTLDPAAVVQVYGDTLGAFVRQARGAEGPGLVVVDLRDAVVPFVGGLEGRLRYVRSAGAEADAFGARPYLAWVGVGHDAAYYVYVLLLPAGVSVGVAPQAVEAAPAAPAAPAETWVLVLASTTSRRTASDAMERLRPTLAAAGLAPVLLVDGSEGLLRYRVTAGRFVTRAEAQRALQTLPAVSRRDAWVFHVGTRAPV